MGPGGRSAGACHRISDKNYFRTGGYKCEYRNLIKRPSRACAQGLIWGIMAIGVYITYRILDLADLTVDGTMCTGGAVCIMLMQSGHSVGFSLFCAFLAGMAAGLVTVSFIQEWAPAILQEF